MTRSSSRRPGTAPDLAASPLAGAFNSEWRCRYECRAAPTPEVWRSDPRLDSFVRVVDVLAYLENAATPAARVEEVLVALADRAAAGDREATRVVVQYLLPFLVRVAFRRLQWGERSREQVLDELLGTAWEVAATGVERNGRSAKIALLRTIEHSALRQPARVARRRAAREMFIEGIGCEAAELPGRPVEPNPGEEILRLLADASRQGLSDDDVSLIGGLFVGWSTCDRLGVAEGVSGRAIRFRRAAAVKRLIEIAA